MRRFVVIAVIAAVAVIAPASAPAVGAGKKIAINLDTEELHITGTMHLNVVENADGWTLHVMLSNGELVDKPTGDRYKGTGSQTISIPSGACEPPACELPLSLAPIRFHSIARRAFSKNRPALDLAFHVVLALDSAGAIQSAQVNV